MSIELDTFDVSEVESTIKASTLCGQCESSTFLLWEKSKRREVPKGMTQEIIKVSDQPDQWVYYLFRCSFFKFNVPRPKEIMLCESFKQKKQKTSE